MAGDALTARTAVLVMRMLLQSRCVWAVGRRGAVTVQTDLVRGLSKLGIVPAAMHVVAGSAGNSALIHHTLHKVIALHPVFVGSAIREVREGRLPQGMIFELPVVLEVKTDAIAHRPVVVFSFDG